MYFDLTHLLETTVYLLPWAALAVLVGIGLIVLWMRRSRSRSRVP